ncbi:XRE family transcriptional regulator [Streptomyces sp. RK23]|uniref:XRE family transcriptional regulator n=1 Tax=Streptomyces TaxID=1883 RepID=UPI001B35AB96|nr:MULTISPECIES: XRE family transcriptional regulator [unclassified Streptomyces]MBQ0967665.1 XRE family transcriptional regulator [Streptomyces sp. RK74B]MBQ1007621.1 XRE family transcriptional regulator [Streptomyces sp. RK23]
MSYRTPRQRTAQQELESIRAWVVARLCGAVGPALTAQAAQAAVEQAKGWGPLPVRELARYLEQTPDGLTVPVVTGPLSVVRLRNLLHAAGHGERVAKVTCVRCGRTDPLPTERSPEGRCCGWCWAQMNFRPCGRCGRVDQIVTRREDGPICRRCYRSDPLVVTECAGCHRMRPPGYRSEDGTALCCNCAPKTKRKCVGCGRVRKVNARTPAGPVCGACYEGPKRRCGVCGEVEQIQVRAADGQPEVCIRCYRGPKGECSVCGRWRHGGQVSQRGGAFHCRSCWPRPVRTCGLCGNDRRTKTIWPLGPVCSGCYQARRATPAPCSSCGDRRIMIGRAVDGSDLCATCCGRDDPGARCGRCDQPGDLFDDGQCPRCVLGGRVRDLLSGDHDAVPDHLQAMADALTSAVNPYPVLGWLRRSPSAKALAQLAGRAEPLTHELLDALPQGTTTRHVRSLLVVAGVLPERNEHLARLEQWLTSKLPALPGHQAMVIRPFAEWHVVRDARRRAARDRYSYGAASGDINDIQAAIRFLTWLDEREQQLGSLGQAEFDLWLTSYPTQQGVIGSFIRWAAARRLTSPLELPKRGRPFAMNFQTADEYDQQLRRCLNDTTLPREVRIIGALVRLYALPVTKIIEITTDRFHQDGTGAYLTIDRHPVLLPPRLGQLIKEQIAQPRTTTRVRRALDEASPYLLPGKFPHRPRNPHGVGNLLKQYDLPVLSARNTAMIEAVTTLPPIVIADLFGISPSTAETWAK